MTVWVYLNALFYPFDDSAQFTVLYIFYYSVILQLSDHFLTFQACHVISSHVFTCARLSGLVVEIYQVY